MCKREENQQRNMQNDDDDAEHNVKIYVYRINCLNFSHCSNCNNMQVYARSIERDINSIFHCFLRIFTFYLFALPTLERRIRTGI